MKRFINILLLIFLNVACFAQSERKLIRDGNKSYEKNNYKQAEINYRKALTKNKESFSGNYNLGNALYKQKNYEEATKLYQSLTSKKTNKDALARNYHNLGNSLLQDKKFEESINAYKNSLRLNPKDKETKYNLEYAKKMLINKQNPNNKNQNNKNNKQQNKDQKQQQKNDQQKQNQQKQQENPQKQISKEDAERMLQALNNDEKNTLEKLKKQKGKRSKIAVQKDW